MNQYLISYDFYRSLGDGEHENGSTFRLVTDVDSFTQACNILIKEYKDFSLSNFKNLTI